MIYSIMLNQARSVNWEFIQNHYFSLLLILAAPSPAWPGSKSMQQMTVALFHCTAWLHITQPRKKFSYIFCIPIFCTQHTHISQPLQHQCITCHLLIS